ncbi:endonuclease domain-containing protein [Asticcacaulis solisilvae]|uniref:endonuclease domain-containing protein n=1 Tax=Asticcacaulis solisilvae TaxID=1217274 RepID=UPI003FD83FCF
MPKDYTPKVALARKMRRAMSEPEWLLWERLRNRADDEDRLNFRRQHAVGPFILDFYSAKAKLAIEVDGSHHYEDDRIEKDASRDAWLSERGIAVYRIPAGEVYRNADDAADGAVLVALERVAARARK